MLRGKKKLLKQAVTLQATSKIIHCLLFKIKYETLNF